MHHRIPEARDSKARCDVLSHEDERGAAPATPLCGFRRVALGCVLCIAMAFVAGCSGDGTTGTGSGGSGGGGGTGGSGGTGGAFDAGELDGAVMCPIEGDPVDTYHANLVKQGSDGVLTFTLVQSDNAPPIRGYNSWQVKITRKDGTSMTGEVVPDVKMPRHMHPAGLQPDVTYDSALGLYKATPVHFFMAGYWMAQFSAYEGSADSGTPLDRGTFYFCVD